MFNIKHSKIGTLYNMIENLKYDGQIWQIAKWRIRNNSNFDIQNVKTNKIIKTLTPKKYVIKIAVNQNIIIVNLDDHSNAC